MSTLKNNWLTEDHIDFEYKKYMVLGYMQDIKSHYDRSELYPTLAEVIEHYKNLKQIKDNANNIKKSFNKDLSGIDWEKMELIHKQENISDDLFKELELIIDFSMPLFVEKINAGKEIYDTVEHNLSISTVGITPLRKEEGYLIINTTHHTEAHVYQYGFSVIKDVHESVRQLYTEYVSTYTYTIVNTFEKIKQDLISIRKDLPNPAVYVIKNNVEIPFTETLFPVAKRFFVTKFNA
ncbi:MAG TPA: hypothetical protein VF411_06505 [Bacteroidia bacterium]